MTPRSEKSTPQRLRLGILGLQAPHPGEDSLREVPKITGRRRFVALQPEELLKVLEFFLVHVFGSAPEIQPTMSDSQA
jgi:chorismate-pyruvate lyase